MNLTVLGSGTIKSPVDRNPAGYLLQSQNGFLLLDVGPGILHQLRSLSSDLLAINLILITHFHPDHCSDLLALLLARFLEKNDANKALTIAGPEGLKEWFLSQARWQGHWLHEAMPMLKEWDGNEWEFNDWAVQAAPTFHTSNSLAYRIRCEGKSVFFSGDTDWQESLIPLARKADLALIECSLPDEQKQAGHLTPRETARFAARAEVKHLVVTHIYPENDTPDLKNKVAAFFDGELTIARDFLQLTI